MAQEGFLYEENAAKVLQKMGLVKKDYKPAGASHDRPDLDLLVNGTEYGVELKKDLASAGSLVIKYNGNTKSFSYGATGGNKEKEFIKNLAESLRVLTKIQQKWKNPLWIAENRDATWLKRWEKEGKPDLETRYKQDLANCEDIYFDLPNTTISSYYNLKDTYYINVGTHGFYLLGHSDPAKINKGVTPQVPQWANNHRAVLRIRIQSKGVTKAAAMEKATKRPTGGQGYQITMEIQFKSVSKSPYNIAPVVKGSAVIQEASLKLPTSLHK